MAGNDVAAVFDAGLSLHQGFGKVADLAGYA